MGIDDSTRKDIMYRCLNDPMPHLEMVSILVVNDRLRLELYMLSDGSPGLGYALDRGQVDGAKIFTSSRMNVPDADLTTLDFLLQATPLNTVPKAIHFHMNQYPQVTQH